MKEFENSRTAPVAFVFFSGAFILAVLSLSYPCSAKSPPVPSPVQFQGQSLAPAQASAQASVEAPGQAPENDPTALRGESIPSLSTQLNSKIYRALKGFQADNLTIDGETIHLKDESHHLQCTPRGCQWSGSAEVGDIDSESHLAQTLYLAMAKLAALEQAHDPALQLYKMPKSENSEVLASERGYASSNVYASDFNDHILCHESKHGGAVIGHYCQVILTESLSNSEAHDVLVQVLNDRLIASIIAPLVKQTKRNIQANLVARGGYKNTAGEITVELFYGNSTSHQGRLLVVRGHYLGSSPHFQVFSVSLQADDLVSKSPVSVTLTN